MRFYPSFHRSLFSLFLSVFALGLSAQVPGLLNYQGRVVVGGASFDGPAEFKLALIDATGTEVYWSNAPISDGAPEASVVLNVNRGIYAVALGDTALPNMSALSASVFANSAVYLRVWFNDGETGFQRLEPDQRIAAVGYAMMAANVPDGAITREKLAPDVLVEMGGSVVVSSDPGDGALISAGYGVFMSVPPPAWASSSAVGAPSARLGHTAVWTGQEMLVWGGDTGVGGVSASGGGYDPVADQWRILSPLNAPAARSLHTAVWTGHEMIIWGGVSASGFLSTGGRFDPATQTWQSTQLVGAPSGRDGHTAVWTGERMIVWGGANSDGLLADGGLYDPAANQWTALTSANPPSARHGATAVWTGDRLLVWGGEGLSGELGEGAQLHFTSSALPVSWGVIAAGGAPSPRRGHTAVWTGQRMIVWGGKSGVDFLGDGAIYDPVGNLWSPLPSENAPLPRAGHLAIWTGVEMVVLGGENGGALSSGGAYDPITNSWRPLTNPGALLARNRAAAVWSGTQVLLFGGENNGAHLGALQRLTPQPTWHFYRKL